MNFEIGETVVETVGFYTGSSFVYLGEGMGKHPTYGERPLKSPARPKTPKLNEVQIAHRDDPDILGLIWEQYSKGGRLLLSCQGSRVDHLAEQLSQSTALSATEALDYISPASEKTHDAKFYIMLPANEDEDFHVRVSNFFGSRTIKASTREDQYNSKSLSVWLMKEHGVLPEKRS